MRFVLVAVGKPRDRLLAAAIHQYETRSSRYWPFEVIEVREGSGRGVATADALEREGERLLERVPAAATIIACDERGDRLTSLQFSQWMVAAREAARDVAFVLGGAFGLAGAVRTAASRLIQLAPFTLPHELARLVLAEQLYRAGTISRGEPYHK